MDIDFDAPVDDTPPAELDPLGVNQGEHAIDIPREMAPGLPWAPGLRTLAGGREPVATVAAALAFLEGQVGLGEYPPGSNNNWITDWYFGWHAPWCAMTVSRALIEAGFGTPEEIDVGGVSTTSRKGWAYCPYLEADFRAADRWYGPTSIPEPGDLVLYDWDGDGWADHVGMLASVAGDRSLWVCEGNTDEGVLRLKHRSLTYVRGFARPPYSAPTPPPLQEDEGMKLIAVTDDRGIFLAGENVGEDGRVLARHVASPEDVTALVESGAVVSYDRRPALAAAVFDSYYRVVG